MAINNEDKARVELAKNQILSDETLDEKYKLELISLLDTTLIATNGISPEEKIQMMTQSIQKLAVSQVGLLQNIKSVIQSSIQETLKDIDKKIIESIKHENISKCNSCKAMEHAVQVQKKEDRQAMLSEFLKAQGFSDDDIEQYKSGKKIIVGGQLIKTDDKCVDFDTQIQELTAKERMLRFIETISKSFLTPWPWVFLGIVFVSPYGLEILKLIFNTFGGK